MPYKSDLPVIDAKRPVVLHITESDIGKANSKDPTSCAAARACLRELHAKEARVHLGRVYIKTSPDKWVRYITPKNLRTEIIAFDRGGKFEPGEYTLSPPSPAHRKGKHSGGPTNPKRIGKGKPIYKQPYHTIKNVRTGPFAGHGRAFT